MLVLDALLPNAHHDERYLRDASRYVSLAFAGQLSVVSKYLDILFVFIFRHYFKRDVLDVRRDRLLRYEFNHRRNTLQHGQVSAVFTTERSGSPLGHALR